MPPGAEVKPQTKVALPAEKTTQYRKVLDGCTAAANANYSWCKQIAKLRSENVIHTRSVWQTSNGSVDLWWKKLQDYINKQGLIYSPKPQTMPK